MQTKPPTYIRTTIGLSLLAFMFALAPFFFHFHFCADDYQLISAALSNPFPMLNDFRGVSAGFLYRPIVSLSLALNFLISGWHPWSYFLFNILIHAINASLCSRLVARLTFSKERFNIVAGLIFFLLPQGLMNSFWISGRTDLLCFTGMVGALLISDRYTRNGTISTMIATALCFVFAIMSKESALLLFIFFAIFLFFPPVQSSQRLYRKRLWHIICVIGFFTVAYFLIRISIFGFFIGDQNPDQPMNLYRMGAWIFHGLISIFFPFDPIDVSSIFLAYPVLFVLIVISIVALLTALTISIWLVESIKRRQIFLLLFASIVSLVIYARSFPAGRLAYLIVPLVISAGFLAFSLTWHQSRIIRIGLFLYFSTVLFFSSILVIKYRIIANIERSAEQVVVGDRFANDTLFVVAHVGRIGQTYVESSMPIRYSPSRISISTQEQTPFVIDLGVFEGTILTDWQNPYTIHLNSDTLYLESSDSLSGFVPMTALKFQSLESIRNSGINQRPVTFSSLRQGIAHSIMIYPVSGQRAQVVYFQEGKFMRVSFKEFRSRFSNSNLSLIAHSTK